MVVYTKEYKDRVLEIHQQGEWCRAIWSRKTSGSYIQDMENWALVAPEMVYIDGLAQYVVQLLRSGNYSGIDPKQLCKEILG